jgi:8-oxo-dGTP pyrophosphatase MutT (NUDIX family)
MTTRIAQAALEHLPSRLRDAGLEGRVEVDAWSETDFDDIPWIGDPNDVVWLDQLTSFEPRTGLGRAAMAELCMLADEHDCRIALNPWAQDLPGALRQEELEAFYVSLGFGWRRDHVMVRQPWATTLVHVIRDVPYQPTPNRSEIVLSNQTPPDALTSTSFVHPVTETDEVLMSVSLKPGRDVEPPGGHIEPGESQRVAARREGVEEVGARVDELVPIGHQRMASTGSAPDGWKYPHPVGYQSFFAARLISVDAHVPNDECAPPRLLADFSKLKPHHRLLAMRAVAVMRRVRQGAATHAMGS